MPSPAHVTREKPPGKGRRRPAIPWTAARSLPTVPGVGDDPEFARLVAEAEAVPVEGWDFSWFDGRATEERPSWGYAQMMADRMARARAALDIQTGGGEVLAGITHPPPVLAATESWPPNARLARRNLAPLGGRVVQVADDAPLPFPAGSFDLVVSRHPVELVWPEVARVLRPGGTFFSQLVGAGSNRELTDFMMGPQPVSQARGASRARAEAEAAGLVVSTCARRRCGRSSTMSARSCTSCARCCGRCPASPSRATATGSGCCMSRSRAQGRSWRTPSVP